MNYRREIAPTLPSWNNNLIFFIITIFMFIRDQDVRNCSCDIPELSWIVGMGKLHAYFAHHQNLDDICFYSVIDMSKYPSCKASISPSQGLTHFFMLYLFIFLFCLVNIQPCVHPQLCPHFYIPQTLQLNGNVTSSLNCTGPFLQELFLTDNKIEMEKWPPKHTPC